MTDNIKHEFNNQAANEPNDAFAHEENNRCAPAENNLCAPAEKKNTTQQTETSQVNETFQKQIIDLINDFSKWCDKASDNLGKWLEKAGPKLDEALQKHGKNLSKLMVKTALVLAALTAQVKKETHEPELGDTKVKTTWTASTLGLPGLAIDSEDGKIIDVRMPLAETANELVRDELPNIDKVHEPEPIKNGAWKTTRELLRDNSAQTTETSMYEAEGTKDITTLQIAVATPETSVYEAEGTKDITAPQIAVPRQERSGYEQEGTKDISSPQTQALNRLKDKNSR